MAFRHRIVSIVTSPAFQFETNVLTDNVYLTSRELSARIPLLHSWLFFCNNSTTLCRLTAGINPNITASFLKRFIIRFRKQKRRRRQKDFATAASAKELR